MLTCKALNSVATLLPAPKSKWKSNGIQFELINIMGEQAETVDLLFINATY